MSNQGDKQNKAEYKGWLYKWTNYIKGYQKRWFVLQNGMLSYYRNQTEMAHTCRGTINLLNAILHTEDSCSFVISNGGANTFHLKASSEVDRQKWVTALEIAKAQQIRHDDDGEDDAAATMTGENTFNPQEIEYTIKELASKIEDLTTCNNLIINHGMALTRSLTELDKDNPASHNAGSGAGSAVVSGSGHGDVAGKIKAINERATLFRITCNAMINASKEYVDLAVNQGRKWSKVLSREHEERLALQSMVETLAKQHKNLEHRAILIRDTAASLPSSANTSHVAAVVGSDDEDEFLDAVEDQQEQFTVIMPSSSSKKGHMRSASGVSDNSFGFQRQESDSSDEDSSDREGTATVIISKSTKKKEKTPDATRPSSRPSSSGSGGARSSSANGTKPRKQRRRVIPEKPNYSLNLWSIMKNCVGRDLSKIPMPVNFNEPLSFLQRLTEDFEYSECLDAAANSDQWEQLVHLAAFTISSYSPTTTRTGKPFNPLLGETFECDRRDDLGWRSLTEQVSHHPPTCAMYAEGNTGWVLEQEFTMSSKFRGKYLQIIPLGIAHCRFPKTGHHYTWRKVTTTVHNIIVGRLWVDNHGEMDITNHQNGDNCHLKFSAYSYFSKDVARKVTGVVTDGKSGMARWVLRGTWDEHMEAAKVLNTIQSGSKPVFETGEYKTIWKRRYPPSHLEKVYNFTQLAVEMNEHEEGVAPTDSRLRPDQRLMEQADWDGANKEKQRLEEKQRAARRARDKEAELAAADGKTYPEYTPAWFKKTNDPITNNPIHMYTHDYWTSKEKGSYEKCPDIF